MPFPIVGAALAGGSLLGGWLGNRARAGQAQMDRDFQGAQAGRQMRFQERMRNTEWQAAVADMEAAGINPALAYTQGGASSPSGASGSGSKAEQQDIVANAVSSALQNKRLNAEISAIRAGVAKTQAETKAVEGRPGRVLTPAVDRISEFMNELFSPRTMQSVQGGVGSSAQTMRRALDSIVGRMKSTLLRYAAPTIGPARNRRRN